jgi:hypothetical protein
LLRNVRDPNYIKVDSGERHVFEVTRTDGSAVHLHFHKNGKCDKPEFFETVPFEIDAGELNHGKARLELPCPTTFADIVHSEEPGINLPLGRNEAAMALQSLLHATHEGRQIQAVNVTDGIAFSWKRFLRNTVKNKEIIAEGVSAVYAVRAVDGDVPKLLFCHPDSSYTSVWFQHQNLYHTSLGTYVEHTKEGRWQDLPILQNAVYFDKGWMNIRKNPEA